VAIGEIPEVVVYRNPQGTFTRSVTAGFLVAVLIMLLVRGATTVAVPFYGVGVFMPITVMGLAMRKHILKTKTGRARRWGALGASFAAGLAAFVFVGQIVGKWTEGGWAVLISFSFLIALAYAILLSPGGYRDPSSIRRIVRDKARVQGAMASIVEWQSLKMQEHRYGVLNRAMRILARGAAIFGVRKPLRYDMAQPIPAGDYDQALHLDQPEAPSFLEQYVKKPQPRLGGAPQVTEAPAADE
jgi:hypothetical protein